MRRSRFPVPLLGLGLAVGAAILMATAVPSQAQRVQDGFNSAAGYASGIVLECLNAAGVAAACKTQTVALAPVVSAVAENGHVMKASAGVLYGVDVTPAAVAGFLLVFDATTLPVDGAVLPKVCVTVPASTTVHFVPGAPLQFNAGITTSFSTTGCFTKTASPAFFAAQVL